MLPGCPTWPEETAARYREAGYWRGETFGAMLRARAAEHGERTAVVDAGRSITYAELDTRADRLAAGLRELGIGAQDRVVVQLPNVAEFFEVCFALFRIGAIPVFALPSHRLTEVAYFCEFSEAAAYITCDVEAGFDHRALAAEVVAKVPGLRHVLIAGDPGESGFRPLSELDAEPSDVDGPGPGDIAFLQLSGGSTGVPKLIPRTHDDYAYSFRASNEICGVTADTVYLVALPAAHNFPMSSPGTFGVLQAGGRIVLARRPSPDEVFPLIERERVTLLAAVPPLALVWLDAAVNTEHDLSSLEVLQVGGAKCSEEVARRVRPVLGATLQQVFGMAEGLVNYTRLDDPEDVIVSTQGRPISPKTRCWSSTTRINRSLPGKPGTCSPAGRTRSAATTAPRSTTRRRSPRTVSTAPVTWSGSPRRATSWWRGARRTRSTGAGRRSPPKRWRTTCWRTRPCTTPPWCPCRTTTWASAPARSWCRAEHRRNPEN